MERQRKSERSASYLTTSGKKTEWRQSAAYPPVQHVGSLDELCRRAEETFSKHFGRQAQWIVAAPGRVNLIGEHTDYNEGFVLPMAIDRFVVIAADRAPHDHGTYRVFSAACNDLQQVTTDSTAPKTDVSWCRYIQGVVVGFARQNFTLDPLDMVIESNVPLGGGLSSSAALETATATLLEAVWGESLDPLKKVLLCQEAEHEFAGVPCGIMDQFSSVMGQADHLMLLDCRLAEAVYIPFSDPEITVLIVNSNVHHELAASAYAERRCQCQSAAESLGVAALRDATSELLESATHDPYNPVFRRARHVVTENNRTQRAAEAIRLRHWARVGELMYASHESLRDDFEVSCDELDLLVKLAREIGEPGGMIGSRMTGGGFGGCTVSLVQTSAVESVAERICQEYSRQTDLVPTVFVVRPARGAHVVQ